MNCPLCQRVMNLNGNLYCCPYCGFVAVIAVQQTTTPVTPLSVAVDDSTQLGP